MKAKIASMSLAALATASLALAQEDRPTIPRNPDFEWQADVQRAPDIGRPVNDAEVDAALQELGRDYDTQHGALEAEFGERRRELVESPEYKSLSRRERKGRVRALKNEFRIREQRLEDEFKNKREDFQRQREGPVE
jgi:hypothetical protein